MHLYYYRFMLQGLYPHAACPCGVVGASCPLERHHVPWSGVNGGADIALCSSRFSDRSSPFIYCLYVWITAYSLPHARQDDMLYAESGHVVICLDEGRPKAFRTLAPGVGPRQRPQVRSIPRPGIPCTSEQFHSTGLPVVRLSVPRSGVSGGMESYLIHLATGGI